MHGLTFNGIRKDYLVTLRNKRRPPWAPLERNMINIPGMPGAYHGGTRIKPRVLNIPVLVNSHSLADLQKMKEDLADWLVTDEPKELIFDDEPDRVYYAMLDGDMDMDDLVSVGLGILQFICPDPYKYGRERTAYFPEDAVSLNNEGTADTDPIFELVTKRKTTFAMISNGEEYNLIGQPADVDMEVVDSKRLLFEERGATLDTWTPNQDTEGGMPEGDRGFTYNGTEILVADYGSGSAWHGPSLIKEITPIEDFEVELHSYVRANYPEQTFRITLKLFDENMNEIGMMRVWDNNKRQRRIGAEARIGPFVGRYVNYPISDRNYVINEQSVWNGLVRITREGDKLTFYVGRFNQQGNHFNILKESYIDRNKEYAGKLKFVQFDAAIHGDARLPNELNINHVTAHELLKTTVDQTPYILDVGDVLTFDHKDDDILINGEPRNDLKNFGGSFFKLKKGPNPLVVSPEDSFDVYCRYRERYK